MPRHGGQPPKPIESRRHRVKPVSEWQQIDEVPFAGAPQLKGKHWHPQTVIWWEIITSQPHCTLWSRGDFLFAYETARLVDVLYRGEVGTRLVPVAAEIRKREAVMGLTADARRSLRIRYVQPEPEDDEELDGRVVDFEHYRESI